MRQRAHGLIHPLLDVEDPVEFRELRPFKHRVEALISERLVRRQASHVSVYFRDLHNGPWFGVREREGFTPASLLKLPIMIAALKQAEEDPAFLRRRVIHRESAIRGMNAAPQTVVPTKSLEEGRAYTVDDLLRLMVSHSDNRAKNVLVLMVPGPTIDAVFSDLGLSIPDVREPEDSMSVKEYGTFFRILYNASYLGRAMSQKALEYLAASDFKEGLAAGVPQGVTVAHKFGERSLPSKGESQLHDCGIVYHPRRPYTLCLMSRGRDLEALKATLREVSGLIYREVDAQ